MENWDLIIIGAGVGGLAAGIYGARSGLKTLLIEEKIAGGTAVNAPIVENYPGFPHILGAELAEKMVQHCKTTGAIINELEPVVSLTLQDDDKIVRTNQSEYCAKAIIIATGAHYRQIGVKGEKEFHGRGVSYCGVCDGPLFRGKRVVVVGGGNSACTTALYLSGLAAEVFLIHRKDNFRAEEALAKAVMSKENVKIFWNTEVKEIKGEQIVSSVNLLNVKTGDITELAINGVFVQIGESPNSQIAKDAQVKVDETGYIEIDINQRTNLSGVYGVGDVTNHPVMQIGTAVGQGITAALDAYSHIKQPYYRK
ncbi:MAG: thioredoxin-disulfide reductase [Crenarchaeota archaeon]|nr:thioredoxin-disulfide reductase [Thermoproteota archaeon]